MEQFQRDDKKIQILESKYVYQDKITIRKDIIKIDEQQPQEENVIEQPFFVAVAMIDIQQGTTILCKKYRHTIKDFLYEIPSASQDFEKPLEMNKLVLKTIKEQTGYTLLAEDIQLIFNGYVNPSLSTEEMYLFRAQFNSGQNQQESDLLNSFEFHISDVLAEIEDNKIIDFKTATAIAILDGITKG